ncbi:hypothetical protein TNCV_783801 [Trichonephila clavipes]|nr:hypothetical protein TNCV_783801 [Trichonephila clavipes]
MTPRCLLKCGEAHQTKDCPIDRVETAYCINCQTYGHMANYSKCPLFPKPRKGKQIKNNYTTVVDSIVRPNTSYAQRGRSTGAVFLDIQKAFDRGLVPPTNHNSAIQTIQDFTAETVCKKISDSVATPPCHVRPTNQDTHSQAGPPT